MKWSNTPVTYDTNGNVTNDGTYTYTWNDRNQLASIAQGQTTVASFTYDPFGRRTKRIVDGTTTQYLHDGDNVIQEQNAAGSATADLLTGLGVDDTFARIESGVTTSLLTDALGSTAALTDGSGAIVTSYAYQPFGKTTASGAASNNGFQFTGRENDGGGAGLYFYRGRYYNPMWGRFISEDPIGFVGGDSNLYAFVGNSPTNAIDPMGTCVVDTVADVGFVLYDIGGILTGRKGAGRDLLLDVVGGLIPCATGLGMMGRVVARYGDDAAQFGTRSFSHVIDDIAEHADDWETIASHAEPAISRAAKGGVSIQTILRNRKTGQTVTKHTLVNKKGKVLEEHFRPNYKPRKGDLP
jgi:RHS repeat-associated protein